MLTAAVLAACTGASAAHVASSLGDFSRYCALYGIDASPRRLAMFLANVGEESGGLVYTAELWGPTIQQHRYERDLLAPWPRNPAEAAFPAFAVNRLAYSLGNTQPGDGKRFRGHGYLETTGRANHALLTKRLRSRFPLLQVPDFEADPDALAQQEWAVLSACDYADSRGLNAVADSGNFDRYCDLVSLGHATPRLGDSNGYPRRLELYRDGCLALEIAP